MVSWAARVAQGEAAPAAAEAPELANKRVAVVDANAIIAMGTTIRSLADVLVTTQEVVDEVKDAAARSALQQLPFVFRSPSSEDVREVSTFASKTGDVFQLSLEDLRLLAVTLALERELHGTSHLRSHPVPVKAHAKQSAAGALPGWGNTTSEEWAAIDAVHDDGARAHCYPDFMSAHASSACLLAMLFQQICLTSA